MQLKKSKQKEQEQHPGCSVYRSGGAGCSPLPDACCTQPGAGPGKTPGRAWTSSLAAAASMGPGPGHEWGTPASRMMGLHWSRAGGRSTACADASAASHRLVSKLCQDARLQGDGCSEVEASALEASGDPSCHTTEQCFSVTTKPENIGTFKHCVSGERKG